MDNYNRDKNSPNEYNGCGYLYFRKYGIFEICKMGITNSLYQADMDCNNEFIDSDYVVVFEIQMQKLVEIEQLLIYKFDKLRIIKERGKYFYNNEILHLIEPFLVKSGCAYKKLTVT